MKDCDKVRCLFSACLEGEASLAETSLLEEHLSRCSGCRNDYAAFSTTAALVRKLPRIEPSAGFEDRVLQLTRQAVAAGARPERIEIALDRRWWEGWVPRLALGGAAAALALVGALTIGRGPLPIVGKESPGSSQVAANRQEIQTLKDLYPDLTPDMIESTDGVLDRVVIQHGSANGDLRVVAPVDYGSNGPVYVTF